MSSRSSVGSRRSSHSTSSRPHKRSRKPRVESVADTGVTPPLDMTSVNSINDELPLRKKSNQQIFRESTSRAAARASSFAHSGIQKVQEAKTKATDAGREKLAVLKTRYVDSDAFEELVKDAFVECDMDGNGTIDAAELWAGVLLLYIYLNRIPWGGRKVPPKKAEVIASLKVMDVDGDGVLDYDEFLLFAKDLCRDVAVDISLKMVLMMFIAPLIAAYFRSFLMSFDVINIVLEKLPGSTFESIITALVISLIPFVEKAFKIDSDKLGSKWTTFFAWFTELQWLPEDFEVDGIQAVFEAFKLLCNGLWNNVNFRRNTKSSKKNRSNNLGNEDDPMMSNDEADEQILEETSDFIESSDEEEASTGFVDAEEHNREQAIRRTNSSRERMRRNREITL